jgi:predicted phage baseplate assembly protein
MSIALTNLDDRRWVDLVEEGRALIPFYSPEWTDHNFHDPGITLIELFAWLAEMDIYRLNRISESHVSKFLSLVNIQPEGPDAALAALTLSARPETAVYSFRLPRSVEFDGRDAFGVVTRFRSLSAVNVVSTELKAVQSRQDNVFKDLTKNFQRVEEIEPFGSDAAIGAEFYLGFSEAFPIQTTISLLFIFQDIPERQSLRSSLREEQQAEARRCEADVLPPCNSISIDPARNNHGAEHTSLEHHSVRLIWEFFSAESRWQPFATSRDASLSEIVDDTRGLTLNGRVLMKAPTAMGKISVGKVKEELYYVRARIYRGSYDDTPRLRYCTVNGIFAEQAAPVGTQEWSISPTA